MAADAVLFELSVRQLAARIAFEGVTLQEHFDTVEICHREASNLCKSGEQRERELHLLKNRNNTTVDFKNLKSVSVP
jgi:hypothetical protein